MPFWLIEDGSVVTMAEEAGFLCQGFETRREILFSESFFFEEL